VLTLPAGPFLMGPWNRSLGHYRRYTGRLLKAHARQAELRVAWQSYWNAFSLPAALIVRLFDKILHRRRRAQFPRVPSSLNSILAQLAAAERQFIERRGLPFGLSLIAVLKR